MKYCFLSFFLCCHLVSTAQSNCPYYAKYVHQGDSILNTQSATKFEDAINKYSIAMAHCPDKANEARAKIVSTFKAIEQLKNDAEAAKEPAGGNRAT
jgi:hypothetical protein